jgi:hypothetical protein
MHGYYVDAMDKVWRLQRPTRSNGIYEDFMTQKFVDPLVNYTDGDIQVGKRR